MEIKKVQAAIEAILFANGEPVSDNKLSETFGLNKSVINKIMTNLIDKFEENSSGICIVKLDNRYQMCSNPKYGEYIRKIMDIRRNTPLSSAAMEVLAIIAYNQPITKAFVEQVRGVDCSGIISSLCNKNLIAEKGRLELPGKPLLYGTTPNFLRCFGIACLEELPELPYKKVDIQK